jgi:riboflavin synthase
VFPPRRAGRAHSEVRLRLPEALMAFMTPKGSVCLDGVSLTLAHVDKAASCIEVALIPVTLEKTTLNAWQPGRRVNVEADMMVKAIVDRLRALGVG